jgi:hypothetical protein
MGVPNREITFAGHGERMLDQGGRRLSAREAAALRRILAAEPGAQRYLASLDDLRVAARASCCPSVAFVAPGPGREHPHGTLTEQLLAEAGWRPDVEILVFVRGDQLAYMEFVHYDPDAEVRDCDFPPAGELQPRPRS